MPLVVESTIIAPLNGWEEKRDKEGSNEGEEVDKVVNEEEKGGGEEEQEGRGKDSEE